MTAVKIPKTHKKIGESLETLIGVDIEKSIKLVNLKNPNRVSEKYNDLFWWKMDLSNSFYDYTAIHFMPYKISAESLCEAEKNESIKNSERPDIDGISESTTSGNIHPSRKDVENDYKSEKIMQIVLVNNKEHGFGPQISDECHPELKRLRNAGKLSHVPRICYYPTIEPINENELSDDEKEIQTFLKQIWAKLIEKELAYNPVDM